MGQTFFQAPLTRDEATGFAGEICCASSRTAKNIIKKNERLKYKFIPANSPGFLTNPNRDF
jgi:hypothetical protein